MEILYEEQGELKAVVFDATIRYAPTVSISVTEHPVERGAAVTDHARAENDFFMADALVTNKPIRSPPFDYDGMDGARNKLDLTGQRRDMTRPAKVASATSVRNAEYETKQVNESAQVLQFTDPPDRIVAVRETLSRIAKAGIECTFVTSIGDFDNMLLTKVTAPKEKGGKVTFTIEARQVIFVDSEIVEVGALETRAERERRLGARDPEDLDGEEDISLAAQLLEAATDIDLLRPAHRNASGIWTR